MTERFERGWNAETSKIADVWLKLLPDFRVYKLYGGGYVHAMRCIQRLRTNNKQAKYIIVFFFSLKKIIFIIIILL